MRLPARILTLALVAALPFAVTAEVYKYVDQNGVIRYTDKPPSKNAEPINLPPVQTYSGDNPPVGGPANDFDSILLPDAFSYSSIQLTSPAAEQVFNNANPTIIASAQTEPALQPGHRLVFLVDGLPYPAAAGQTSTELANLERGSHTVQAVVLDGRDAIQAQSEAISFQLNQPSALRPPPFNPLPKPP